MNNLHNLPTSPRTSLAEYSRLAQTSYDYSGASEGCTRIRNGSDNDSDCRDAVFQKDISKKLAHLACAVFLGVIIGSLLTGCGQKYSEQGHILSREIHNNLVSRGICSSKDCNAEYEIYGGHGNQINFSIYNPKDRKVLAVLIEFVVENGLQITGGVPISIWVYPKSRREYGNMLFSPKPIIKVEVTK